MSTWAAALVAAAAIGFTYFFCVRPMMRGRGHCGMSGGASREQQRGVTKREIADLREDLRILRAQEQLRRQAPPSADG
ncbi:hypothetical protein [Mycobacterium hubeiense]|uniref:hypothetical protein n=1 Tax=Mycobacterium hubeiense TaxID=1867256 RepID=UPI000C7F5900|nr:hypothetical protein [Mycobacterium sp. QGD 101]